MTDDEKRREEFLDRCLMESDSVADALELSKRLESFVTEGAAISPAPSPKAAASPKKQAAPARKKPDTAAAETGKNRRMVLTDREAEDFVNMCAAGASTEELRDEFGLNSTQVYYQKSSRREEILAAQGKAVTLAASPSSAPGKTAAPALPPPSGSADEAFANAGGRFEDAEIVRKRS